MVDQGGSSALQAHPDVPDVAYALSHEHFNLPNNFSPQPLPPGWRGWVLDRFGGKAFEAGAEDSLHRLKRAAETRYRREGTEKP